MSDTGRLEINFTEDDRATRADVILDVGGRHDHGWARSKRDPFNDAVHAIGEEVAAART